jgi:hypothetical protein
MLQAHKGKNEKGEQRFAFSKVVGADGVEPPTYAL